MHQGVFCLIPVIVIDHGFRLIIFKLTISSFLLLCSSLKIICLVVNSCEHTFKAFERTQFTREMTITVLSRVIPSVWSALQSHVPKTQTNQHHEGIKILSQAACSVSSCHWVSAYPEVLTQVQQVVLATAQTLPRSAKRLSRATLSSKAT